MLKTSKIVLTLVIVIAIMEFLMLFNLPNYNLAGYITIVVLLMMASMFILKLSNEYIFSSANIALVLIPFVFLLAINLNKHYIQILKTPNMESANMSNLKTMTIILSMIQIIALYFSINNTSKDFLYKMIILSLTNTFVAGLLWREVAFYVTDG